MKSNLFCTFTREHTLDRDIDQLLEYFDIYRNRLFLLSYEDRPRNLIITYNVENFLQKGLPDSTISIHRKKETNTLYTINALNSVIKAVNNGVLDKTYRLDWGLYENSILLTDTEETNDGHRIIYLNFEEIMHI